MRLWQKIFLTTLALMVLSTTLVSSLLLKTSRDALWQREYQRAVSQQQYLAGMLRAGVVSHRLQLGMVQLEEEDARQAATQILTRQAMDDYLIELALLDPGDQPIYSSQEPPDILDERTGDASDTVYRLRSGGREGQWFLDVSMPLTLESLQCRLAAVYDVSDLQRQLTAQAERTVLLCLASSLIGAGVLLALVWFLLRPLAALDRSARRVAEGRYDERLDDSGSDELAGLARDMNAMAGAVQDRVEQLERVAEDRKAFIGNLAHEMKTPLTSILGFADLLYLPKELDEGDRVEYARVISEEAKRLRSLSGKLLELITLGSANIELAPAPLREVVEEVAVSLRPVLEQSGLTLGQVCSNVWVDMDRELFKSLLYNLLDNGRKASEKGGRLDLAARAEGDAAVILVRDYGRGIPQAEINKITQPFYMVDKSRARKAGGAGLGLALCREIVEVHLGTMEIQSIVGEGTLIRLTFPLNAPPEEGESHA